MLKRCAESAGYYSQIWDNKNVLECGEFKLIYNKLNADLKDRWDEIVNIAIQKRSHNNSTFSQILLLIRNNIAFHYQAGKMLRKGFVDHFYNSGKNDMNEHAYYSIGNTMNETRFYYCDAAVEGSMTTLWKRQSDFSKEFENVSSNLNFTIMELMKLYLHGRPYK